MSPATAQRQGRLVPALLRVASSLPLVAALLAAPALTAQASAAPGEIGFVAAASTAGNRSAHTVRIPAEVSAGDVLLLTLTTNSTDSTIGNPPAGWYLARVS